MSFPSVSVEDAHKLWNSGHMYLDVRTHEEYAEGHAPGSVCVPVKLQDANGAMVQSPEFVDLVQKAVPDKATKLVVACRSGARSKTASEILVGLGYSGVTDVAGGWTAWAAAGLPSEK